MEKPKTNYVSIPVYARLCGTSRQAIFWRINQKSVTPTYQSNLDGSTTPYIDITKFPPVPARTYGKLEDSPAVA